MKKDFKHGDTLIEILFSVAVFGLVAISTLSALNNGIKRAQASLESTVARTEIEAQAEALRFIQNTYAAQSDLSNTYASLWNAIAVNIATDPGNISDVIPSCSTMYNPNSNDPNSVFSKDGRAFVINSRLLNEYFAGGIETGDVIVTALNGTNPKSELFTTAPLYPRLVYKTATASGTDSSEKLDEDLSTTSYKYLKFVEGIWIVAAYDKTNPTYYDFYIRTCWNAPGDSVPSTISSTIRLYNPDVTIE